MAHGMPGRPEGQSFAMTIPPHSSERNTGATERDRARARGRVAGPEVVSSLRQVAPTQSGTRAGAVTGRAPLHVGGTARDAASVLRSGTLGPMSEDYRP